MLHNLNPHRSEFDKELYEILKKHLIELTTSKKTQDEKQKCLKNMAGALHNGFNDIWVYIIGNREI